MARGGSRSVPTEVEKGASCDFSNLQLAYINILYMGGRVAYLSQGGRVLYLTYIIEDKDIISTVV